MNAVLDAVPGGVLSLSLDLRIQAVNRGMAQLVGRAPEELLGEPFDLLLTGSSKILFQTHVYPALMADGRVEEVFLTLDAGDGPPIPILLNAVRSADNGVRSYEALIVRILARSKWEAELLSATRAIAGQREASQALAQELEAASLTLASRHAEEERNRQFRDAFVGVVSHELRTPITTIFGMSHILRERHQTMDPETVRQRLDDIAAESDHLRRLTEDLLVLSRAEGGKLDVGTDPVVVGHVVRAAVESERARSAGHQFHLAVEPGLPLVLGDDLYIEQILRNFLSNAAKYSPTGTTVRVSASTEEGGVAVRVVDAGPGLGAQDPDQLFDLFYRAPDAIRHASGAGIGLFVSRQLAQAMGGRVWAVPAPRPAERGAEFGLWLPGAIEEDDR